MKKLKGMKKGFSSLENKKLKNSTTIQGGMMAGGSSRTAPSNVNYGEGCWDTDHYSDDVNGTWTYAGREVVC